MASRRRKPSTRISSFSTRTWKRRQKRRTGFARSITNKWTRATGTGVKRCGQTMSAGSCWCSSRTASSRREAAQRLRNIQESLAQHEFVVGNFYYRREMNPAAANRLNAVVNQYPLYSNAGEALYEAGVAYSKMGPRFRKQAGEMFARIVREYPLSSRVEDAKRRLEEMELPVPQAERAAYDREKYDRDNYHRPGLLSRSSSFLKSGPDVSHAAKSGDPAMTDPKPTIPASVPVVANTDGTTAAGGSGTTDVSATTVGNNSALEKNPDARNSGGAVQSVSDQPLPTNRDKELKQLRAKQAKKQAALDKKKKKKQPASDQSEQPQGQGTQGQTPPGAPNAVSSGSNPATAPPPSPKPPPQQ